MGAVNAISRFGTGGLACNLPSVTTANSRKLYGSVPMRSLTTSIHLVLVAIIYFPAKGFAQNAAPAAHDVSTVKPHDSGDPDMTWREDEDGVIMINVRLKDVVADAWSLRSDQVSGERRHISQSSQSSCRSDESKGLVCFHHG